MKRADPSYSFSSTTAQAHELTSSHPATRILRGTLDIKASSPGARIGRIYGGPRDPNVFRSLLTRGKEGGKGGGEIYFDEVAEACRATTPRRLNFDTFANNVYVSLCCIIRYVLLLLSVSSFSLLRTVYNNTIYHETRFETSPLTLERRSGSLKMSFLKFISVRSMQPVVSRPRQRLNHGLHRYFHVTFVRYGQFNL